GDSAVAFGDRCASDGKHREIYGGDGRGGVVREIAIGFAAADGDGVRNDAWIIRGQHHSYDRAAGCWHRAQIAEDHFANIGTTALRGRGRNKTRSGWQSIFHNNGGSLRRPGVSDRNEVNEIVSRMGYIGIVRYRHDKIMHSIDREGCADPKM